jgi:membrane-associated protein
MTMTVPSGDEVRRGAARRRRAEIACVTGIALKSVFALALLPLVPSLLGTDPVLLEALRGSTSAMASGGAFARVGEASLVLAVLAPLPTLLFATPFFWWAGRLWGPKAAATLGGGHPSAEKWAQRSGAHLERFGGVAVALAPFLPVPSSFIYAAAGWTGMSLRRFMVFDLIGMLLDRPDRRPRLRGRTSRGPGRQGDLPLCAAHHHRDRGDRRRRRSSTHA